MLQKLWDYERQNFSRRRQEEVRIRNWQNDLTKMSESSCVLMNERFRSGAYWKFILFKINVKEIASSINEARSDLDRFIQFK